MKNLLFMAGLVLSAIGLSAQTAPDVAQTAVAGSTVVLSVTASGTNTTVNPFGYVWFKSGQPLSVPSLPTVTLANITADAAGSYFCTVTNSAGSTTSNKVNLTVAALVIAPTNGVMTVTVTPAH